MTEALINGRPGSSVPVDDRALLYGDCLFETIAFRSGQAPLWRLHWQRLSTSSARLGLVLPDENQLLGECRQLAGDERCVLRVTLSRGSGGRAYEPLSEPDCRRIVHKHPWPDRIARQREHGVRAVTSPVHLACGSVLAGMKHGNRLEQVLAARDCAARGADEALLFDAAGHLVEAISSNLVVLIEGRALTPETSQAGVAGVGLQWLEEQDEVQIEAERLTRDDAARAEEIMVINSVAGIRPITAMDERRLEAGPSCRAWQRLWTDRLES